MRQFNIPRKRVSVVPEACDEKFSTDGDSVKENRLLKERLGIKRDFILYTAATRPHKNVSGLLKAFSRARNRFGIEQMLVIAGPLGSEHAHLLELTKNLDLNEHVIFTGYVSDGMLPALYRSASLSVYPSFYEGFGLPVLESMASGTPVVASNTTSLPEVVGDAGILVSPYNFEEMATAMYKVLSDDAYRFDLVALGEKRARAFSWEETAKQVLGLLEALCWLR
jgi:glycosyltransferase involved in cell wall biosynthesis